MGKEAKHIVQNDSGGSCARMTQIGGTICQMQARLAHHRSCLPNIFNSSFVFIPSRTATGSLRSMASLKACQNSGLRTCYHIFRVLAHLGIRCWFLLTGFRSLEHFPRFLDRTLLMCIIRPDCGRCRDRSRMTSCYHSCIGEDLTLHTHIHTYVHIYTYVHTDLRPQRCLAIVSGHEPMRFRKDWA
jgi:hypothetical protein